MSIFRYTGARGITEAATKRNRNRSKYTIVHPETGLRLFIEEDGSDSYVSGDRNDATGFTTKQEALDAGARFGLAGQGYKIELPKN